ncbi:ABC transporter ATP-binding protein [Enterobacter roggenkampii]|uniref:ABC transporter ATP-binding protein n=1 Tax=Enterobacter roggenkampii TaxID=1812935 RepID=UPI003EC000DF
MSLLTVRNMSKRFGGLTAVDDVSITVNRGEIYGLIGPNGAGKTTCFNLITGLYPADSGEFSIADKPYFPKQIEKVTAAGIARTFQNVRLFNEMSVLENLQMGAWLRRDTVTARREMNEIFERFPRLGERQHQLAGLLSGGEQQLLALNRALLSRPRLLILDEPSMGLAPKMVENIFAVIAGLRERGVALLLIEQNARLALEVTDSAWVMDSGSIVHHGESKALLNDDQIAQIYLGEMPV